jgi:hypothetical protein
VAGEKRGKLYELVVGQALRQAFPGRQVGTQVVMEHSLVRSDWVVEGDFPILVFVTHSSSETKNTQKFWRDCAELLQALRATRGSLISVGVIFDANLLQQLVNAEAAVLDLLVLAEGIDAVKGLISLTDAAIARINAKKGDDYSALLDRLNEDGRTAISDAVEALTRVFRRLRRRKNHRPAMAHLLRSPRPVTDDVLEPSKFYTGCAALMLVEGEARLRLLNDSAANRIPADVPSYFRELGGTNSITGTRPSAALRWLADRIDRECVVAALNKEETAKSAIYRSMLRSSDLLPAWVDWVIGHSSDSRHILRVMTDSFSDPRAAATRYLGCDYKTAPAFNWAWTFLVATMREIKNRKQAFGAATVAEITGNRRLCVQNSILSDYECGTRDLDARDLFRLAEFFCQEMRGNPRLDSRSLRKRLLHEVFVDKIGPHSVHPIPALIREVGCRHGVDLQTEWLPTSIGAMAGATGNAARVRVLRHGNELIWWRSAFDGNEAHKAKEVGARIFGLTTEWAARERALSRSPHLRLTLVVDGDFAAGHLDFFQACGADVLLRPQMIADRIPCLLRG